MAETSRPKMPDSLYKLCLSLVERLSKSSTYRRELRTVPENVLVDLYMKMFQGNKCVLGEELQDLDAFFRVLKASSSRLRILRCFQAVIEDEKASITLPGKLSSAYQQRCEEFLSRCPGISSELPPRPALVELGLRLGGFLNEAGWYADAERTLLSCRRVCQAAPDTPHYICLTLECCHRLLHAQAAYCCFPGAADTYSLSLSLLQHPAMQDLAKGHRQLDDEDIKEEFLDSMDGLENLLGGGEQFLNGLERLTGVEPPRARPPGQPGEPFNNLLLRLYTEFSVLHFMRSDYADTYKWSTDALRFLRPTTPPKITVDVLRICGKACVTIREFSRAGMLMQQVVAMARLWFGQAHPVYAFTLLDYGFYLLNVDSILHSVTVLEQALAVLQSVFVHTNLHVAGAHEDLSYALYVHEYSSGRFNNARGHANRAIHIMEKLLPPEHLMLATAKRVKALILEEIALDSPRGQDSTESGLLMESETLHRTALNLSLMALGEKNVQTAKHYGNLGRLYQSMQKFEEAEAMQLRAIAIKEELLGKDDYEVGLSVGHLASLYNYHMKMHSEAEELYFRSISISLKLFGERYSGLEYDYLGLVHVNTELQKPERAGFYNRLLQHWRSLRDQPREELQPAFGKEIAVPIQLLKMAFFPELQVLEMKGNTECGQHGNTNITAANNVALLHNL